MVCVVQVAALTIVLVPTVPPSVCAPIAAAALLMLTWSFLIDTLWLFRRAR